MTKLLIWGTFSDALKLFVHNIPLYLKGIVVPLIIFVLSFIPLFLYPMPHETPGAKPEYMGLLVLIQGFVLIWIMNISYRLALTGQPGKKWWSMIETWTVVWMFLFGIITSIVPAILAAIAFFAIALISKVAAIATAAIIYGLGSYYIGARLIPLFPSIAIGEKKHLQEIWEMTKGEGIRIMLTLLLVSVFASIALVIFGMIIGSTPLMEPVALMIMLLVNMVILSVASTVIALIYKALKGV